MDLGLRGKRAVITGASQGIGLAVARGLAAEGVDLFLCARGEAKLKEAAAAISRELGVKAVGIAADLSEAAGVDRLVREVGSAVDGVDILINNAGTGTEETILEAADEKWLYYWNLHVMASVRTARGFVPMMRKRGGGVILNTASICAKQPLSYEPIYNTTKAALVMLTKCLANELVKDNIRVNTVNPGLILTPDWLKTAKILGEKEGISAQQYLDRIAKQNTPIGRFATPEELAHTYLFLCSERASYTLGASLYVDGGWLKVVD